MHRFNPEDFVVPAVASVLLAAYFVSALAVYFHTH